jgi:hypothetical protein
MLKETADLAVIALEAFVRGKKIEDSLESTSAHFPD